MLRVVVLTLLMGFFLLHDGLAADSTSFNPTSVQVTAKSSGGVPVGTVIAWPVATNPDDWDKWLECNGQSITQSAYPELFAVVGGAVPDYRGLFLRGVGGNSAALGVAQGDAIRNITAGWGVHGSTNVWGAAYRGKGGSEYIRGNAPWGGNANIFDASRVVPTANENRPVNKAVRYVIRALP